MTAVERGVQPDSVPFDCKIAGIPICRRKFVDVLGISESA